MTERKEVWQSPQLGMNFFSEKQYTDDTLFREVLPGDPDPDDPLGGSLMKNTIAGRTFRNQ